MPGSKKGERRGNARKRAAKPERLTTHETPNEIMRKAVRRTKYKVAPFIERKIRVSRIILGVSGDPEDTTPKEALLEGMHHNLRAARDWIEMLDDLSKQEPTPEITLAVERAEREIERLYDKMGEFAFKVAGFIHPKLQATHISGLQGVSQVDVLRELFEEIDERERASPVPIEHKPKTGSG